MRLTVLNSGSDGNGYLLDCQGEILIIECGVPVMEVKKALNFDLSRLVGCYITHGHTDHAKYRRDYELLGVDMFTPYDTETIRQNFKCGGFDLQAFRLPHGDIFSYGVLIRHVSGDTTLFMTDFEYTEYLFKACKVNHYLIECNYQPQYVDIDAPNKEHKLRGHCSIDTCRKFLIANHNDYMKDVLLIHLGKDSTNPRECIDVIKRSLGEYVNVDYARPNTVYNMGDKT